MDEFFAAHASRERSILALLTDGFGAGGGIARYNSDLLNALSESSGVKEIVAVPRVSFPSTHLPRRLYQTPARGGKVAWSMSALHAAFKQPFDVVFCGHLNLAPISALIAQLIGARLWVQAHGIDAWLPATTPVRWAVAQATLVTAVSRHTRQQLLSWADIDPQLVRVLPNTVGQEFQPRNRRPDLIGSLGLIDAKVILTVGRLSSKERYKGQDRIIKALPSILKVEPTTVYLIAGAGDDLPRLRSLVSTLGVESQVRFLGYVAQDDLTDVFALSDVYVMPSTGEGFGIVFLEAACFGVPVIGGNRDGSLDPLADGVIGKVIDPENQAELVNAILGALRGEQMPNVSAVSRFRYPNFKRHVDELVKRHL